MLVWSGRGILSVFVFFVVLCICIGLFPSGLEDYGFVIASFVTAAFSWFFGNLWNSTNRQGMHRKNRHTIFWIPMQYWGIICSVIGIIILQQNSLKLAIGVTVIFIAFVGFLIHRQRSAQVEQESGANTSRFQTSRVHRQDQMNKEEQVKIIAHIEAERLKRKQAQEDPRRFMPK